MTCKVTFNNSKPFPHSLFTVLQIVSCIDSFSDSFRAVSDSI